MEKSNAATAALPELLDNLEPVGEPSAEEIKARMEEVDRPKPELVRELTDEEAQAMIKQMQEQALKLQSLRPPPFIRRFEQKIGRNEPCPCGSQKKYKRCCGS